MAGLRLLSGLHGAGQKFLHLIPIFFAEAFAQAGLSALPVGQRFLELLAACGGELQVLLAAVGAGNALDQFFAQERTQRAAEGGGSMERIAPNCACVAILESERACSRPNWAMDWPATWKTES